MTTNVARSRRLHAVQRSKASSACGAAIVLAALSACSAPAHSPSDLVGKTLSAVNETLPDDALFLVQDASAAVGREPTYNSTQLDSDSWTIVAACSSAPTVEASETVEIAVIPTDEWRGEQESFDQTVTCDGLTR